MVGSLLQKFTLQPDTFLARLEFSCEYATLSATLINLANRLLSQYQIYSVGLTYQLNQGY